VKTKTLNTVITSNYVKDNPKKELTSAENNSVCSIVSLSVVHNVAVGGLVGIWDGFVL